LNQKYKWLEEGQFIRVRQATLQNHMSYSRVFGLKSHSNIMILPSPSKIAEEMHILEEKLQDEGDINLLTELDPNEKGNFGPLAHPVIISRLDKAKHYQYVTDLTTVLET
jgi:hypothetical protein